MGASRAYFASREIPLEANGAGRHLDLAVGTVKNHVSEILRKLGARDRTHGVLKALANHLLSQ
jgi:DNA-binding NarL/FixJ family response regulator